MQLLLAIAATLASGILVVLVPGACMLAGWRLDRIVAPPLVPAAALALGLVPLAAITAATLAFHQPIEVAAAALALFVLFGWAKLASRERARRQEQAHRRVGRSARDWLLPLRDLVAGDWLRATPNSALVLALLGSVLAMYVGFYAWNDSLYHIAQALKLLELDAPSFTNTLQFEDATAHPGYLLPTWHEALALVSFVARVEPITAAWILPGLTFPIAALAVGGLAWTLARAREAVAVAVAAVLLLNVANLPYSDAITNAMQPGVLGLGVLAPLALAMVVTALWPDVERASVGRNRDDDVLSERSVTRAATILALIATASLGMLHVSYLWVLGMGILGAYLLWTLRSPWPRAVVRRHLLVGAAVAIVAATVIALLLPGLTDLETTGRDAATELAANESERYEGKNAANLEALLRGDPEGRFHLRADYLVQAGGLALLGLFGLVLALLRPRWPGGWYLAGAALLTLTIALVDRVFPTFVQLVTLDQARRIERVLPHALGLATLTIAIALVALLGWRSGGARRYAAVAATVAAAIALAFVVDAVPVLGGYDGEQVVNPRIIVLVLVALLIGVAVSVVGLLLRLLPGRRGRPTEPATWWPGASITRPVSLLALALLLVAGIPALDRLGEVADEQRLDKVPIDMRGAELRFFDSNVARVLRTLPTGSTVLADPRARTPYVAMAIAPVYVVSSVPRHTALTPRNRVAERFETAVSFFADDLGTRDRTAFLLEHDVDAVIVHPFGAAQAQRQLRSMPGVREGITGTNHRIWLVDRDELEAASR